MTQVIQTGKTLKAGTGKITINFPKPFAQIPVVVVSSFWENAEKAVGYVETIDTISLESFTVVSSNSATNYYVNWIAIS
ncbi:gp53-like domain-containing protein [Microcystis aeruginosa]|jgi:hypothetical protein|uniref:H-type lectin domain-containing protein n=1 Tax=Microcystis aeruginosa Sj TaxID=1979544 RepID=A0A2Z6URX9_MICAE|nr:H-type lectin domain-containing protein [Microcystis aeruginosa]MDB9434944.1 H-type lectin domain-containing protein [Microcystis aeruginosa CS-552/01]GBL12267.1 hypothetical protein MSj_03782 [Microcystis aeruginosa Sj]